MPGPAVRLLKHDLNEVVQPDSVDLRRKMAALGWVEICHGGPIPTDRAERAAYRQALLDAIEPAGFDEVDPGEFDPPKIERGTAAAMFDDSDIKIGKGPF